nr:uncharacterized protein LOC110355730 [Columba livia]
MEIPGGRVGVCPIPREGGTCLDLCSFDEECPWGHKCCSNGCGHVCTAASLQEYDATVVPQHGAKQCTEECEADSQCPWGQRCTRTSCGRVCTDIPGVGCSVLQAEKERALSPGAVGHVWSCAASTRSVPGATSAAATAAATSAHGCLVILRDRRAAAWWQADTFVGGLRVVTGPSWPVPSLPPPAIKHTHGCLQPLLILSSTRPAPPGPGTGPCVPGAAPAAPGAH